MAKESGQEKSLHELRQEAAHSRDLLTRDLGGLRYELDFPLKFRKSFQRQTAVWITVTTVVGVICGVMPARTKRISVKAKEKSKGEEQKKEVLGAGLALAAMKFAAPMLRPAITSFITKKWATTRAAASAAANLTRKQPPERESNNKKTLGMAAKRGSFFVSSFGLLKQTFQEWLEDKAPQLGAALAYYTVFSLAPLILVLLAIVGLIFHNDPAAASKKITEQMSYFLDKSAIDVVQNIARQAAQPSKGLVATIIGILLALFGASGVFGQLQDALNTIWGVKAKPGGGIWGFVRLRFLSFTMVGGICFLLLVSLTLESVLKGFSHYVQAMVPGGIVVAMALYLIFDLAVIVLLFAIIFKFLPDAKIQWRDVWVGAALTAILFAIGKWALGLYLGSGSAASAYGAASSLITLLLWIYYSSQILLFGAEFTQVYAQHAGRDVVPDEHAVRIETKEIESSGRGG